MTSATPPILNQLEQVLRQMVSEHRLLLTAVEAHEAALRSASIDQIERTSREQDAARQRVATVDTRRRTIMHQIARQQRAIPSNLTITKLAELYPDRAPALTKLKTELAALATEIQQHTALVARIAQSVLGHVNATLRLVARAAAGPGTYTKTGNAPMPARMGVLNVAA